MTELSPAQKALAAFNERHELCGPFDDDWVEQCLAAALEAVAKLEDLKPGFVGPCDESYGSCLHSVSITERDFNYSLALERKRAQMATKLKLLAIAAELRGTTTPTETP